MNFYEDFKEYESLWEWVTSQSPKPINKLYLVFLLDFYDKDCDLYFVDDNLENAKNILKREALSFLVPFDYYNQKICLAEININDLDKTKDKELLDILNTFIDEDGMYSEVALELSRGRLIYEYIKNNVIKNIFSFSSEEGGEAAEEAGLSFDSSPFSEWEDFIKQYINNKVN